MVLIRAEDKERQNHVWAAPQQAYVSPLLPVYIKRVEGSLLRVHPKFPEDVYTLIWDYGSTVWQGQDSMRAWVPPVPITEVVVRDTALWVPAFAEGARGFAQHVVSISRGNYLTCDHFAERLPELGYSRIDTGLLEIIESMDPSGMVGIRTYADGGASFTARDFADPETLLHDVDLDSLARYEPKEVDYALFSR